MKNETILLIGAAGNNGQATLNALVNTQGDHLRIRAAVRNEARAQELRAKYPAIETVVVDLDQPASLTAAFDGVNRVFMIPGNVENRSQHAKAAVDAAKAAGTVKQFVLYSVVGAEWEAILFARQFREAEKYLEASGLPWTHLRTIWFQENFINWAAGIKQGAFYFGVREGRFAPLNVKDIGAIAARVLTTDGHERKAYNITGPELLSGHDMAAIFSRVTGRQVDYVSPQATSTYESLIQDGWPEWQAKGVLELFEVFATDQAAEISPDGETLLGRPLTRFEDFVHQHKSTFI